MINNLPTDIINLIVLYLPTSDCNFVVEDCYKNIRELLWLNYTTSNLHKIIRPILIKSQNYKHLKNYIDGSSPSIKYKINIIHKPMKIDKLHNKRKCLMLTKKGEQCKNWRPTTGRSLTAAFYNRSGTILLCKYHSNLMAKQYDAKKKKFQSNPITKLTPARFKY